VVNYSSPFFTAQKQSIVDRMDNFLDKRIRRRKESDIPQFLDDINLDRVLSREVELTDIPPDIINSDEVRQELRAARAEREIQRQLQETLQSLPQQQQQAPTTVPAGVPV